MKRLGARMVYGGWKKRSALLFNLLSGLAFLVGGLVDSMTTARSP